MSSHDSYMKPFQKCTVEKPDRNHFCQIHHREETLVEAIARFVRAGLAEGDVVVSLAPGARHAAVSDKLREWGIDADRVVEAGELVLGYPEDFRKECMRDGVLDEQRFQDSFRATFDLGGPKARIRMYGEVSSAFWHEGDVETAIRLDYLCDELLRERKVSVFCGYLLDPLDVRSYQPALEHICRVHSCIADTEDDERLRYEIDRASNEVLGIPLSVTLNRASSSSDEWSNRLPLARRTLLWLQKNMPSAMIQVLDRVRRDFV